MGGPIMLKNALLCLVVVVALSTVACGPDRTDMMAIEHVAEFDGWEVLDTLSGSGNYVHVIRSKVTVTDSFSGETHILSVESCTFTTGGNNGPKNGGCDLILRKKVVAEK
jgi:hypothetical protein